ncbi:CPBP family intramembrane metalloprotease [candidate division KSB1 bacterium]|nr:CPBP family intramembrane metalloprotease [candidate division KSB1 bacterium]
MALLIAAVSSLVFGTLVFVRISTIENPIPLDWPTDALIVLGLGFAFYLAIMEETIFRSFIFERTQQAAGSTYAVPIQGAFYGLMYYKTGVPSGVGGVIFGSLFGMALGYLVKKSGSIYLSMMVNVIVTFIIFLELLFLGKYQLQ